MKPVYIRFLPLPGKYLGMLFFTIAAYSASAQYDIKGLESLFTIPKGYTATYTAQPPLVDGDIGDSVWLKAQWSADFVDIEGDRKPVPPLKTNVKMLWNDSCLFICAHLREPDLWATLHQHDTIIFMDDDFEVFIDPDNDGLNYYELEVNPNNTVFDLFLSKPYRNKGNAIIAYNFPALQTAVQINGTLNQPGDRDSGWTVEIAIPFKALDLSHTANPAKEGTEWRINFSRVEWDVVYDNGRYVKKKGRQGLDLPEHNWVWSPQGVINMHYPERWGYLKFVRDAQDSAFSFPYSEKQKQYLWLVYYRQQEFFEKEKSYANSPERFNISKSFKIDGTTNELIIEATPHQFMAFISDGKSIWSINQDGQVQQQKTGP